MVNAPIVLALIEAPRLHPSHTTEHTVVHRHSSGCASRLRCQFESRAAPLLATMSNPLPPGLDPVTAGRFGLWLLGKRNHFRAMRRSVSASRVSAVVLQHRFVALIRAMDRLRISRARPDFAAPGVALAIAQD
jgi:hypothetical protein